jgi:chromosome segregation ATPase
MGGDIISVQRDFARLFKARQQTLIDQISGLETQAADLRSKIEETERRTEDMAKSKDFIIASKDTKIEEIKHQMRKQAQEFDDMMSQILDKLKKQINASTQPKELLNAGVPIQDQLSDVNADIQARALLEPKD